MRLRAQVAKLARRLEPREVRTVATSRNCEIVQRSGPRDPYPGEDAGVRGAADADLLLVSESSGSANRSRCRPDPARGPTQ